MDPPISSFYKTVLEGQEVFVNSNAKVIILELNNVFNRAGIIFKWKPEFGSQAFGINKSIYRLIQYTKSKLLINYQSQNSKKEYWINYDALRDFVEKNMCEFRVAKYELIYNIPLALFNPKPIFSGA